MIKGKRENIWINSIKNEKGNIIIGRIESKNFIIKGIIK